MPRVRSNIITGIDIGTHQVKAVVVEIPQIGHSMPHIIGRGMAESRGMRHGYIVNAGDAARSIKSALKEAEKTAGVSTHHAYVAVGGIGLEGIAAQGSVVTSRADSEITDLDITQVLEASEQALQPAASVNRKVLHAIPLQYRIDGKDVLGRPFGMKGARLEVRTLFITTLEQHLNDLIQAIEDAGVEVLDVMASPIAASFVSITRAQKKAGCVLANIGSETLSIAVFENNIPISLQVFPIGSTDITNDIALGFKISLEEAEVVKRGVFTGVSYERRQLDEIMHARLTDMFELIQAHLKKLGRSGLLPAGIVLTGGGSGMATIEDIAKAALELPARVAIPNVGSTTQGELHDLTWAVAYGLCVWGSSADQEESMGIKLAKQAKNKVTAWLRQFLP